MKQPYKYQIEAIRKAAYKALGGRSMMFDIRSMPANHPETDGWYGGFWETSWLKDEAKAGEIFLINSYNVRLGRRGRERDGLEDFIYVLIPSRSMAKKMDPYQFVSGSRQDLKEIAAEHGLEYPEDMVDKRH